MFRDFFVFFGILSLFGYAEYAFVVMLHRLRSDDGRSLKPRVIELASIMSILFFLVGSLSFFYETFNSEIIERTQRFIKSGYISGLEVKIFPFLPYVSAVLVFAMVLLFANFCAYKRAEREKAQIKKINKLKKQVRDLEKSQQPNLELEKELEAQGKLTRLKKPL